MTEFEKESIKQQIEDTYKLAKQFEEEAKQLERKLITADMTNAEAKLWDCGFKVEEEPNSYEQYCFYNIDGRYEHGVAKFYVYDENLVCYTVDGSFTEDDIEVSIPLKEFIAYSDYLKEQGLDK